MIVAAVMTMMLITAITMATTTITLIDNPFAINYVFADKIVGTPGVNDNLQGDRI